PGSLVAPTGTLSAPGMWPRRLVLPSKPRYSAGARASIRVTSGDPSRPRTSEVVSRARFGPRNVKPVDAGGTRAFETSRPSATQSGHTPPRHPAAATTDAAH